MPLVKSQYEFPLRSYEPRPTDVFLCTYIKSGTTWVQVVPATPLLLPLSSLAPTPTPTRARAFCPATKKAILTELLDIAEGSDSRVKGTPRAPCFFFVGRDRAAFAHKGQTEGSFPKQQQRSKGLGAWGR